MTANLRAALLAALPDMTPDQAQAARTLVAALTPPMMEPTWPGAPVIAGCHPGGVPGLHTRRNIGPESEWECDYCTADWDVLAFPRPLTPAEYEKYGIPMPYTHATSDETARRLQPEQDAAR